MHMMFDIIAYIYKGLLRVFCLLYCTYPFPFSGRDVFVLTLKSSSRFQLDLGSADFLKEAEVEVFERSEKP